MGNFPDLLTVLVNLAEFVLPMVGLLQAVTTVMGLYFVSAGLIEFWGISNGNAEKFVGGRSRFSVAGALTNLFIGALFTGMGTLELIHILSRTYTGGYANSVDLSYLPKNSFEAQALAATAALMAILKVIGFIAICNGLLTANRHVHGQIQHGIGLALAFFIGGVICWNFQWTTEMLNCSMGFNLIGFFVPFGTVSQCVP